MSAVLDIAGLRLSLPAPSGGRVPILRGVDLTIAPGEIHGLVGESGAGKSMIGRVLLGLQPPAAAVAADRLDVLGQDLRGLGERRRRRLLTGRLTLIPQEPMTALNPVQRIGRQVEAVLRLQLGLSGRAAADRALALLADVRLREPERVLRRYPHELSGGMRQRVLIAMAFAAGPPLVIADEPTTALDVTVQRDILQLIRDRQRSAGTALLFVTHDLGVVAKLCDRVTVLHAGRVVESGETAALFARPAHDYTRALLAATPRYDHPAEALRPIPPALAARLQAEAAALDAADA
ncbi:MAG: ABC transporter ATP-binding protein [Dongiaceae bacterium]